MNGLYGMPETAIEDADHAETEDLTSKINKLHRRKPRKISLAFLTMHPPFVLLHSFLKVSWPKAKRPNTTVIAGTSNGLTINVSSNTPIAVTIPN